MAYVCDYLDEVLILIKTIATHLRYKLKPITLLIIGITLSYSIIIAQNNSNEISGTIENGAGEPLPGINIIVKNTRFGTATDIEGSFGINDLKPGEYTIVVSGIGFKTEEIKLKLENNRHIKLDIVLEDESVEIDEVVVQTNSVAEDLKAKGYSISVIESTTQKNLTKDLNEVLKTTPGIHIREAGGLGSGFKLSLNGLSGNQIRYFIDGIPMENFGSSLSLNNYPINLIDKLEIYKGVVPISLGSDALGGAINIVTDYWQKSFLDAAYSFGSFNTHRFSLNGQYANNEQGYFLKGALFFNHSDNNYLMKDVPVNDLELGNFMGTTDIERFNDDYTSGMINLEAGVFDKPYADKLSLSVTAAASKRYYQHPDNNILRVFGDFHSKNNTFLVSAAYRKKIDPVQIKAYTVVGRVVESVVDTSSKKYNWAGDFIQRGPGDPKGELFERRSLFEQTDWLVRSSVGMDYDLNANNILSVNATQNYLERSGEDKVDEFNRSFESPNYIQKNLIGLAYTYKDDPEDLNITLFGKQYWYSGKIVTQDYEDNDVTTKPSLTKTGYGFALSYKVIKDVQLKLSFEKAYRIPESFEILGDGIYVNPNPTLNPEKSHNVNLGSRMRKDVGKFELTSEVNLFYRFSEDFIRFNPLGPFGEYENLNNVRTEGIEGSIAVNYSDLISLNTNVTYQNLTDRTEFDEGLPNANYKDRVPNVPYFFGNMRLGYSPSSPFSDDKFSFYWSIRFVQEFFLTWENLGNRDGKNIIPQQLTQDFQAEYSANNGMYNISFSVNNIFDKLVYDNFNIQKPGRSYSLKLRYFLN